MAEKKKFSLDDLKQSAQKGMISIDINVIKDKAIDSKNALSEKAAEAKDAAVAAKEDIEEKLTRLDRMLSESITEYNDAYTIMNDKGIQLFVQRRRSIDTIEFIESLVNSIANRPKSFDSELIEISFNRKQSGLRAKYMNIM